MEFVTWVQLHWDEILEIWAQLVLLSSLIVKLVPALPEKHLFLPLVKFLGRFVALNTSAPNKRPKN